MKKIMIGSKMVNLHLCKYFTQDRCPVWNSYKARSSYPIYTEYFSCRMESKLYDFKIGTAVCKDCLTNFAQSCPTQELPGVVLASQVNG